MFIGAGSVLGAVLWAVDEWGGLDALWFPVGIAAALVGGVTLAYFRRFVWRENAR